MVIRLRSIARTFVVGSQPVHALDGVDEDIEAGEHVAIMGPSGSGKSTLLNILGCLDKPDEGSYQLDGREVGQLSDEELTEVRRNRIGFVFQFFHLVPRLTAAGNVELPLIFAGVDRRERRERVARVLESVSLSDRADHRPDQLSGGERQRVALARATVMGAQAAARRRAHGQPRQRIGPADPRSARPTQRRGSDSHRRDPRSGGGLSRGPGDRDGRRQDRTASHRRRGDGTSDHRRAQPLSLLELLRFAVRALTGHRLRSALSLLGMSIGVAAVIVLTGLGEGARRYVVGQFQNIGADLLIVTPGRTETIGFIPGISGVPNDLTLDDARALLRLPEVKQAAPVVSASEMVSYGERRRNVAVMGTTSEFIEVQDFRIAQGSFLPEGDWDRGAPIAVIGSKTARELFPGQEAVGRQIRIGDRRVRVIGVLAERGVQVGVDFDDIVIFPVTTAMRLFNRSSLVQLLIQVAPTADLDLTEEKVLATIVERHGEEDVTVLTQGAVVDTLSAILTTLTLVVGAIAAISLSVAGIGIMNVMLVSVSERTSEVGLLRAIGARRRHILLVFLAEAALLSTTGGIVGLVIGVVALRVVVAAFPVFPAATPWWASVAAVTTALGFGLLFGVLPARRATELDPIEALAKR